MYQVEDDKVVVFIIAVGKREKNAVYDTAEERLAERQSDNQDTQSAKQPFCPMPRNVLS